MDVLLQRYYSQLRFVRAAMHGIDDLVNGHKHDGTHGRASESRRRTLRDAINYHQVSGTLVTDHVSSENGTIQSWVSHSNNASVDKCCSYPVGTYRAAKAKVLKSLITNHIICWVVGSEVTKKEVPT